jgi:hypothetical protein
MKRINKKTKATSLSIVLLLILSLMLASTPTVFSEEIMPQDDDPLILHLSPQVINVKIGETFTIYQYTETGTGIATDLIACSIEYAFNSSIIHATGFDWGNWGFSNTMNNDFDIYNETHSGYEGAILNGYYGRGIGATHKFNGNETVYEFYFEAVAEGHTQIEYARWPPYTGGYTYIVDNGIISEHGTLGAGDVINTGYVDVYVRLGDEPAISSPSPANGSTVTNKNLPSVSCYIADGDGDEMDWTIETYPDVGSNSGSSNNGTISCPLDIPLPYGETITWYVNVTDGHYWTNNSFTFNVRDEYEPVVPTEFSADTINRNRIDLSWVKGSEATHTFIAAKQDSYPNDRTDGISIYNNTGTSYSHTGLNPSESWYYRAWSYNNVDNVWSASYVESFNTTEENLPPVLGTPTPANGTGDLDFSLSWSISITDPEGDDIDWTIECSNGQTNSGTNEAGGTKSLSLSGLDLFTEYTVWVNTTDEYSGETDKWFTFTTKDNSPPDLGTPTPGDGSTIDTVISVDWSIPIEDSEGDLINWTIECDNGQSDSANDDTNGTKILTIDDLEFDTEYTVWVNTTDAGSESWTNETFTFNTPTFDSPSGFNAAAYGRFQINISWTAADYADSTLVRGKLGSYPTSTTDGILIHNGTGVGISHDLLNASEDWYYRAWSWNETKGVYSDYAEANEQTDPNLPPTVVVRPVEGTTDVTLTPKIELEYEDTEGDLMWIIVALSEKGVSNPISEKNYTEIIRKKDELLWVGIIVDKDGEQKFNWTGCKTEQELQDYASYLENVTDPSEIEYPYVGCLNMTEMLNESTEYTIWVEVIDEYDGNTTYQFNFTTGEIINTTLDLIYVNATVGTGTGYNFISILYPSGYASDMGQILIEENVSWEAVLYFDPVTQSYQDGIVYDGESMSGTNFPIYPGDVILVVVTETELDIPYSGFSPSMPWEDIQLYEGWNLLGRTGDNTTASGLEGAFDSYSINWTSMYYWNKTIQQWSTAYLEATGTVNFDIATGTAILTEINEEGTFRMGGW